MPEFHAIPQVQWCRSRPARRRLGSEGGVGALLSPSTVRLRAGGNRASFNGDIPQRGSPLHR
jgi:hypothetical protein